MKLLLKQKITTSVILMTLIFYFILFFISDINIGKRFKLFEDVMLTFEAFVLVFSSFIYSYELKTKHKEGIFVIPISFGISRKKFYISNYMAIFYILLFFSVVFIVLNTVILLIVGDDNFMVLWQVVLYFFEAMIISALLLSLSEFLPLFNSAVYTIFIFLIGNGVDEFYIYFHYFKNDNFLHYLSTIFYYLFINFSIFDKHSMIVNHSNWTFFEVVLFPIFYFCVLYLVLTIIGVNRYKNKILHY